MWDSVTAWGILTDFSHTWQLCTQRLRRVSWTGINGGGQSCDKTQETKASHGILCY